MERVTLAQLLGQVKFVENRIRNRTGKLVPVALIRNGVLLNYEYGRDEFECETKETWAEIQELIERRRRLRCALVIANAKTMVKIQGKQFTIQGAIEYKKAMKAEKRILEQVLEKVHQTKKKLVTIEGEMEYSLNRLLHYVTANGHEQASEIEDEDSDPFDLVSILQSPYMHYLEATEVAVQTENIYDQTLSENERCAISAAYKKENMPSLFDPLDCEKLLHSLKHEAELFLTEVDVCIAEVNAITNVDVQLK